MDAKGGGGAGGAGGAGGGGLKGSGESQLEVDRRLFRKQLQRVEEQIASVQAQRNMYRERRKQRDSLPVVAIVGYTNAGKSSLLNALCATESDTRAVYADDLLFATLDPTTRRLRLPGGKEVLVSDTVGFIQKLPTKLVNAFRGTLEELEDANLILHVVDAVSPLVLQHVTSVQAIVDDLRATETAQILVLNKADRRAELSADGDRPDYVEEPEPLLAAHEGVRPICALPTSARTGAGLEELLEMVELALLQSTVLVETTLPYSAGEFLGKIHKVGTVLEEEYAEKGTRIVAYVPPSLRNRMQAERLLVRGQPGFSQRLAKAEEDKTRMAGEGWAAGTVFGVEDLDED